jgi:putative ABC transport system ATP-binding protein
LAPYRQTFADWFPTMTPDAPPGSPLALLDGVSLSLAGAAGPVEILRGVSLAIAPGEAVALLGPSGSGKSSLLMVLGGLERPTGGRVVVAGQELGPLDENALARLRRRHIGIVFQSFHLLPTMTALENVAVPLELGGRRDAAAAARAALGRVGLSHRGGHYPGQLSGGEQQRVAIARALANHPKVVLADEPTGNLDSETGKMIFRLLHYLAKKENTTIIVVTHDLSIAGKTDAKFQLRDGKLVK